MKTKKFIGKTVLEEATTRAKHILLTYDHVVVNFSGGKDSLVTLELLDAVRVELGITKKLIVLFYDEELYPDTHVQFMLDYYHTGRFEFIWHVSPLKSQKFILGDSFSYVQWDCTREWVRTFPDFATTHLEHEPIDQSKVFSTFYAHKYPNAAVCIGVRAAESSTRLAGILGNPSIPCWSSAKEGFTEVKPIYDWQEKDIFRYIYDRGLKFTEVYNLQAWTGAKHRVATPLVSEGIKNLDKLKQQSPEFFDRISQIFPEVLTQEKYHKDIDTDANIEKYGLTELGLVAMINDTLLGDHRKKALKVIKSSFNYRRTEVIEESRGISLYPLYYLYTLIVKGQYKKFVKILPDSAITQKMRDYEERYKHTPDK